MTKRALHPSEPELARIVREWLVGQATNDDRIRLEEWLYDEAFHYLIGRNATDPDAAYSAECAVRGVLASLDRGVLPDQILPLQKGPGGR